MEGVGLVVVTFFGVFTVVRVDLETSLGSEELFAKSVEFIDGFPVETVGRSNKILTLWVAEAAVVSE